MVQVGSDGRTKFCEGKDNLERASAFPCAKLELILVGGEEYSPSLQSGSGNCRDSFLWSQDTCQGLMVSCKRELSAIEVCMILPNAVDQWKSLYENSSFHSK